MQECSLLLLETNAVLVSASSLKKTLLSPTMALRQPLHGTPKNA